MVGKDEFNQRISRKTMSTAQYLRHLKETHKISEELGILRGADALFEKTTEHIGGIFPEISTGDGLGEIGDAVGARYDPKLDTVYFTTKSGKEKILKGGKIYDNPAVVATSKSFMPPEPEIEESSSPYVAELIKANESW